MVENEVLCQKQAIFLIFLCSNGQNGPISVVFGIKLHLVWGCTSRISPTSVSGHMGSIQPIQLPWHSGMLGTSRKLETDLQLGVGQELIDSKLNLVEPIPLKHGAPFVYFSSISLL